MTKIVTELQEQLQWHFSVRALEDGIPAPCDPHGALLDAIASGDGATARNLTEESIARSHESIAAGHTSLFTTAVPAP